MKRVILAVVGVAMLVTGVLGLALPVTADDGLASVECGSGFSGKSDEPGLVDAGRDYTAELEGAYGVSTTDLTGACADKITLRRVWGWPVGGLGLVLVAGVVVSRVRS